MLVAPLGEYTVRLTVTDSYDFTRAPTLAGRSDEIRYLGDLECPICKEFMLGVLLSLV